MSVSLSIISSLRTVVGMRRGGVRLRLCYILECQGININISAWIMELLELFLINSQQQVSLLKNDKIIHRASIIN